MKLRLVLSLVLCFMGTSIAHRGSSVPGEGSGGPPEKDCSLLPAWDMMPPHRLGSAFHRRCPMQSGWLRQYFVPQHHEQCQHTVEIDTLGTASSEEGVSRRDFVTGGLVAGMAAGMIASDTVGGVRQAEAQTANPMGKDWWPSPWG